MSPRGVHVEARRYMATVGWIRPGSAARHRGGCEAADGVGKGRARPAPGARDRGCGQTWGRVQQLGKGAEVAGADGANQGAGGGVVVTRHETMLTWLREPGAEPAGR